MNNEELIEYLKSKHACPDSLAWLADRDSAQMWAECERADWLLWWAGHIVPREELVLAACDCAETALRFVPEGEERPNGSVENLGLLVQAPHVYRRIRQGQRREVDGGKSCLTPSPA